MSNFTANPEGMHFAGCSRNKKRGAKVANAVLATAMSLSLAAMSPLGALASESSSVQSWSDAYDASQAADYSAYSSSKEAQASSAGDEAAVAAAIPSKYDLRDPDGNGDQSDSVVTSVKLQSPWDTCWAFAAIAASECSIISETGQTAASSKLDLSERHLAWFSYVQAPKKYVGSAQAGEGFVYTGDIPSVKFKNRGYSSYVSTIFAAGIGPVSESVAPYKNDENVISCEVTAPGETESETRYLKQEQIDELREQGYKVTQQYYSTTLDGSWYNATWSLSDDLFAASEYTLENSYILPDVCTFDSAGNYTGVSQEGMTAVKEQLLAGRGVAFVAHADFSRPGDTVDRAEYLDVDHWAQYTYKEDYPDHAMTIVGYDDDYPASNFLEGHQPEKNGAWLVKNSWGAGTEEFPNYGAWGEVDGDGNNTGYLWISYYDQTICKLEAFDYDVNSPTSSEEFDLDQYNYMSVTDAVVNSSDASSKLSSANEFTASEDRIVRAMACETAKPDTTVTYDLYLLDNSSANPTDGKLVLSKSATYEYGGFHRLMLDESDWVAMRENQRYSVVVTQKCNADGKYYQVAPASSNKWFRFGTMSAKVNEKESWTFNDGEWTDWKTVATQMEEKTSGLSVDNMPIKGYSQERDWASVETLDELQSRIDEARELLAALKVSADGSDVPSDQKWVTQAEHDALSAAIDAAQAELDSAGADYKTALASTTPSQGDAESAIASLEAAVDTGKAAAKAGTASASGDDGSGSGTGTTKGKGDFVKTADPWANAATAMALACAVASGVALVALSRRRNER